MVIATPITPMPMTLMISIRIVRSRAVCGIAIAITIGIPVTPMAVIIDAACEHHDDC
jgi:hypothetical protein